MEARVQRNATNDVEIKLAKLVDKKWDIATGMRHATMETDMILRSTSRTNIPTLKSIRGRII